MNGRHHVFVFDIDGTLSDCGHRVHHLRGDGPKNWDAFYAGMLDDAPIEHAVHLCQRLYPDVVFLTGRPEEYRDMTRDWIAQYIGHGATAHRLFMRSTGDYRDDAIVKLELIASMRSEGYEVIMAFEDRKRVVEAYRANSIPCAQVAPGDF